MNEGIPPMEPDEPEDDEEAAEGFPNPDFIPGDFVANADQMLANMGEVARVAAVYSNYLADVGFESGIANQLVVDWHKSFWEGVHSLGEVIGDFDDDEDDEGHP